MNNFFYSLITFIIAIFFIVIGIIGLIIPWSESVRMGLIEFLLTGSLTLFFFGLAFVVVGSALVAYILLHSKRKSYYIRSNARVIEVEEEAINQYLHAYWKRLFPENDIPTRVSLRNNKIHISADFPHLPLEEQRPLLEKVRNDLASFLAAKMGYKEEFYLSASFQANHLPHRQE